MSKPTDIITPETMIEWLKDGMADRDEIEDQLHLMESHGVLSSEDVQIYMRQIAEVMDTPVPLDLPTPSMYYPLDPQVTPTQAIDQLFPANQRGNRSIRKTAFLPYFLSRGITRRGEKWYRFNGRFMEFVSVKEIEDEIYRAATECGVDVPSSSTLATIVRQSGQSLCTMPSPMPESSYLEEDGRKNLVFENCILRGDMRPGHRDRSLIVLPFTYNLWTNCPLASVCYDPAIKPPEITLRTIEAMFPEEDQRTLLFEIIGYILWHGMNPPALFVLYGPGGTGKTIITDMISAILGGDRYVSGVNLAGLMGDIGHSYEMQNLEGKRLNIQDEFGEQSKNVQKLAETLKNLSSGGRVYFNHKYGGDAEGRNTAKLLFCSNSYPSLGSDSGIARRLHVLTVDNAPHIESKEEHDILLSHDSLSWMAMRQLEAYIAYLDRGCRFTAAAKSDEEQIRVLIGDDIMVQFLESDDGLGTVGQDGVRGQILDAENYLCNIRTLLYGRYRRWCDGLGATPMTQIQFLKRMDGVYGVKASKPKRIYSWQYEITEGRDPYNGKDYVQVRLFEDARPQPRTGNGNGNGGEGDAQQKD